MGLSTTPDRVSFGSAPMPATLIPLPVDGFFILSSLHSLIHSFFPLIPIVRLRAKLTLPGAPEHYPGSRSLGLSRSASMPAILIALQGSRDVGTVSPLAWRATSPIDHPPSGPDFAPGRLLSARASVLPRDDPYLPSASSPDRKARGISPDPPVATSQAAPR